MNTSPIRLFKVGDIFFWILVLAGAYFLQSAMVNSTGANSIAIIEINGEIKYRIDLKESKDYILEDFDNPVKVTVRDHRIAVTENDCSQKVCIRMGYISRPGQMIACVPKKILIYIPAHHEAQDSINAVTG
jgi:hypothetical protein